MSWSFRPGQTPEEQLNGIEKEFGIENIRDLKIVEDGGNKYLYIYRNNETLRVQLQVV